MKRRRIDFYDRNRNIQFSEFVPILKEDTLSFIAEWTPESALKRVGPTRRCFYGGYTQYYDTIDKTFVESYQFTWKPHEYSQEARESCLYAYWFLKRRLGKDLAGIIAKFVWSTRFEEIWENEEEEE